MKLKRENLSTQEMDNIVRIREKIRESSGPEALRSEELPELMDGLELLVASLIAILETRRAALATMLAAVRREREKVEASLDMTELSTPGNIEKLKVLEGLINDYCLLNEGLRRTRRGRKPSQSNSMKNGKETL
jgi:hypothetical protein